MANIIHVITDKNIGGAGVFLSHLISADLEETGSLVVLPQGSLLCSLLKERDIPYITYPTEKECSFSLHDVSAIGRILEERRPRLLVSHASLSSRIAAKRLSVPTISVRHCDTPTAPAFVWLYNAVTDVTVTTSYPLEAHLQSAGIKRVLTIENGYTDMGVPDQKAKIAARKSLSLDDSHIAIGLSGRLAPIKGQETALRALALLGNVGRNFTLCFLGEGEEEKRLRTLSFMLGLEKHVRFLGFSPDPRPFYHAIDAHISASLGSETSSLSLAEGMSAGCPTFASDTEGNRARLGAGGCLFPPGDATALSKLYLSLLDERERIRLGALARARARTLPTWEDTRARYKTLFDVFLRELPAKGCFLGKDMLQ